MPEETTLDDLDAMQETAAQRAFPPGLGTLAGLSHQD